VQWRRNPSPGHAWCDSARNRQKLFTWPGILQQNNAAITSAHPHGINTSRQTAQITRVRRMLICQFLTSQKAKSKAISPHQERWLSAASVQLQKHQHSSGSSITDITSPKRPCSILEQLQLRDGFSSVGAASQSLQKTPAHRCAIFARLLSRCSIIFLALLSRSAIWASGTKFGPSTDGAERCRANLLLQRTHERQGRINYRRRDSLIDFLVPQRTANVHSRAETNSFSIQKCQG
jgi:hypothetical protein